MEYREEFIHNCDSLCDSRVTVRTKAAAAMMRYESIFFLFHSILNDHDKKRQILQLELLYPERSFISEVLRHFQEAMASERERDRKKGESTCLQLLFSFTVLLSEINSILEKYCSTIASIVNEHLNWAIVYDMSSIGFVLNICHILFSVCSPSTIHA